MSKEGTLVLFVVAVRRRFEGVVVLRSELRRRVQALARSWGLEGGRIAVWGTNSLWASS